jgi:hypothetical protein
MSSNINIQASPSDLSLSIIARRTDSSLEQAITSIGNVAIAIQKRTHRVFVRDLPEPERELRTTVLKARRGVIDSHPDEERIGVTESPIPSGSGSRTIPTS